MSNQNPQPRIDLELSRTEMYPPVIGDEQLIYVTVNTRDESIQFDFTVNGESGSFPGIKLESFSDGAHLLIDKDFIANYNGTWPVQLEVIGTQGTAQGSATLTLYDTRTMQAARVDVRLVPSDVAQIPPAGETTTVRITGTFYDANGLELPSDEIVKQIEADPVPGVEVLGNAIFVSSMPHASEVHLLYAGAGASGNATLTLVK